ncbi:MAG: DUF790 family protein [Magnetococcales bacterium]|nr:DUF790 family protein [Magnetococcales bacterium]NGZ28953.1 DUF790 family protein [Magnetococcales bacterium]
MLTKDLLRYDIRNGVIRPRFVDGESRLWLEFCENLINLYEQGIGQTAEELDEEVRPLLAGSRSPLIAKGLNKLLLDRCTFRQPQEEHAKQRVVILTAAAQLMRQEEVTDLQSYRWTLARQFEQSDPDQLAATLYNDLPARQPLVSFDSQSPTWLMHRYNLAQAQGLLLWANQVEITLKDANPGHRRIFFRYLRFLQLLYQLRPGAGGELRVDISGPLSVLAQTSRYGLQLANLLTVLVAMKTWKLEADIHIQGNARLILQDTDGLHSHYTRMAAYVPDSFHNFIHEMKQKAPRWTVMEETPLVDLGGQNMLIPDLSFQHDSGVIVHLELFHPWHGQALRRRVEHLTTYHGGEKIAIGVDRALLKEKEMQSWLESSPWFQANGFFFLDFPSVNKFCKLLDHFAK